MIGYQALKWERGALWIDQFLLRSPSLGFEMAFFFFFSCRDLVIIDFFGNLRRAIKLVLNSPTRLSTVVSVWSVAHTIRK